MEKAIAQALTQAGMLMARPWAFGLVVLYTAGWLVFERDSFDWHGAVTLITLCMTLFIQRAEHRDTQAIHAKLDELLSVIDGAKIRLTKIDDKEPEEIEAQRERRHTTPGE